MVEGTKDDGGKLRYDLVPVASLEQVVRVLTYGAAKYEPRNWENGISWGRVFGATMRHLWSWWKGEENDPESGLSHLAHAATNLFFLMEYAKTKREFDDRPNSGEAAKVGAGHCACSREKAEGSERPTVTFTRRF